MTQLLRAIALGALNQGVSSGTHFMLSAFLVRQLSQEGFGAYGLAFSAMLLALNVADAVLMTPMTVALSQAPSERAGEMAAAAVQGAVCIAAGVGAVIVVVAALIFRSAGSGSVILMSGVTALAASSLILKEALVRIAYALRREATALVINSAFAVAVIGLTVASATRANSSEKAVAYYALAAGIAVLVGMWVIPWRRSPESSPIALLRTWFVDGRWYLIANIAYWLRLQSPILVATWTMGLSSVGILNAARILVTPPVLLNPAMAQVALPRLSRLAAADSSRKRFRVAVAGLAALLVGVTVLYCCVLWGWFDTFTNILLGRAGRVPALVVGSWCAFVVAQAARNAAELAVKALRRPKQNVAANALAVGLAFPACVGGWLIAGESGIVGGAALAEFSVVTILLAFGLRRQEPAASSCSRGRDVPSGDHGSPTVAPRSAASKNAANERRLS